MPGGSGTVGGNYVYSAKPDGLTVLIAGSGVLLPYITRMSVCHYDVQKMEAVLATTSASVYYTAPGIVSKVEDLPKATGIIFGGSAGTGPSYIFVCSIKLMDLRPQKVVLAYSSASEARRAFLSGAVSYTHLTLPTKRIV